MAKDNQKLGKTLPYILFAFFSLLVITNNLFAKAPDPEEFGKNSIMAEIIPSEQNDFISSDELIEETGPAIIQQNDNDIALEAPLPNTKSGGDSTNDDLCIATTDNDSTLISTNIASSAFGKSMYRDKVIDYKVETGDTISGIAYKFNVSVATILWSNNLSTYSMIKPGMTLKILPTTGILHKVARGETIASIAKKYKVDEQKILDANKLSSVSQIKIGQDLMIPDGVRPSQTNSNLASAQTRGSGAIGNILAPIPKSAQPNTGTKLLWPTAARRISQYYGWRHTGIDIAGPTGTAIYAAESGVVETAGWNRGGYGNYIIINHGNGLKTLYGHASKLYVSKGEKVTRGQVIMAMGSTGRSTGPHLHFEVRIGGAKYNPLKYIR